MVPVVVRLQASPSTSITASGLAISVENTTGIPLLTPKPRNRLRTAAPESAGTHRRLQSCGYTYRPESCW